MIGEPTHRRIRGLACAALVLAIWAVPPLPANARDDQAKDEEPVGWPLTKRDKRELDIEKKRTPLPESSAATTRALQSWPTETPDASSGRALVATPEIAPLDRFTPEFQPRRIEYSGQGFALTIASAALLDQIALRLNTTGETIEIVAHSTGVIAKGAERSAPLSTHEAVKLSFKRAMLIRLYLLDEGVRAGQIELRALPAADDGGPSERVDISIPVEEPGRIMTGESVPEGNNR